MGQFGSGWAWLVHDGSGLAVVSTPNQDNPISDGKTPLLGVDVWEHAYYLKYQNKRPDYLDAWWNTVNWAKVAERFGASRAEAAGSAGGAPMSFPSLTGGARPYACGMARTASDWVGHATRRRSSVAATARAPPAAPWWPPSPTSAAASPPRRSPTGSRPTGRDVGLASIYRALELLERLRLARRVDAGEGVARYEPVDPAGAHHHHLVCDRCGEVAAFEDVELERAIARLADRVSLLRGRARRDAPGRLPRLPAAALAAPMDRFFDDIARAYDHGIQAPGKELHFLVLVAFLLSFGFIRTSAHMIKAQVSWWPGNVETKGGTHIHHMVWGILLLLSMGYIGIATREPEPVGGARGDRVRDRHGPDARRVRALAEPGGRVLVGEGPPVDRRRAWSRSCLLAISLLGPAVLDRRVRGGADAARRRAGST